MVARLVPGLALAAAGGSAALLTHAVVPALSPTLVAILLGLLLASRGGVASASRAGLRVASRQVLRVGVALLGLQVVLPELLALGWPVLVVVAGVVVGGIAGTLALARPLGVPPERALLVACGFSICGAAAVAAVDGVRRSKDEDVATVVSLVVVWGSVAMLALPLGAMALGLPPTAAGAWSGASVHEVGQVVVAGGLIGGVALQVAVAIKLGRVLMLAPVLAAISYRSRRAAEVRPRLVPVFLVGFVACGLVRDVLPGPVLDVASAVQEAALAMAMFALGCSLEPAVLRRTGRPLLALAGCATVLVALLGLPAALLTA
ncbi:putative sulfate exporter family transporter [Nocardioides sp. YIM 152315]|uniref:YeiH family protein n=1 Tax=Nocardioides sp. YIM 152315 TaxID=3031760 RepID=UPI0023DB862C|nr:putative sulfate exporter family transporter [Nocardioides sp. YIM 152315]MDF1605104.1 putative sulfate exporter family transporter [Nocardioides sp. YIM 152315]